MKVTGTAITGFFKKEGANLVVLRVSASLRKRAPHGPFFRRSRFTSSAIF